MGVKPENAANWGSVGTWNEVRKKMITGDAATEQRRLKPGLLEQEFQDEYLLDKIGAVSMLGTAERCCG